MNSRQLFTAYGTIFRKEVGKIFRIPMQTLVAPTVTTLLFFLVIGGILGGKIGDVYGVSFVDFAVPGVVLLAVVVNTFVHVAKNLFMARKVHSNIEEMTVSPMPPWVIAAGFASGGIVRGLFVGVVVLAVSLLIDPLSVAQPAIALMFVVLTAISVSALGVVAGLASKNLEDISTANTFLITPATYIGGVFHSITFLPPFAAAATQWNPIFYLINGFRFGFLGVADTTLQASTFALGVITILSVGAAFILSQRRTGLSL